MLLLVLRHPTCASCVAWMCCRMSNSIKHVWACPDQSSRCGHRSSLQSCCCWCYVIQPVHHILHEIVVRCPILSSMYEHVPISHRGVGIDLLQSCSSLCYVIQLVLHVIHECVVGCPILSSMYEHVPIYHSIVLYSTPSYTLCALTSHHRVRCSSGLKQLAKHHSHVTYTPCRTPKKP